METKTLYWLFTFLTALFFFGCEKKNTSDLEYQNLFKKADIEYKNLNYVKSSELLLGLLVLNNQISPTNENQRIRLKALTYLGDIFDKIGEKTLALQQFEELLTLADKHNNEAYQVQALLNMAKLGDDPVEVEQIFIDAKQKFTVNKNKNYTIAQIEYALALLYAKSERIEDAFQIFNKLLKENHPNRLNSYIHKGIGIAFCNNEDFNTAIENFEIALNLSDTSNKSHQLNIIVEKANVYSMSKQFDKFEELISELEPSLDTIQDLNLKKRINELELNVYTQTNNIHKKVNALTELLLINEKSSSSLGSIAVNLKNYELKKETEAQKAINNYLKTSLILGGLLFLSAISIFILFYRFFKKQSQFQLLEKERKLKDLENESVINSMNAFMNGQENERKEHAAQLHDSLGANLAAVNMHLSLLKKDVPEKKYKRISGMLKNVITETRNISHNIMPPLLVNQGVIAAITEKTIEWSHPKLQIDAESNIERVTLDDSLEIALYRGILECVNNIIRSAEASHAKIKFEQLENNTLHISISDNGKGFDVSIIERGEGGLGINGVKNRIKYFKGNFNIESEIGKGTTVYISVPVLKMKQTA